jgi:F-type H+-transporting ATPase subunit delta
MSQAADRYAKALFESVQSPDDLEEAQASMSSIRDIIIGSKDFRLLLSNPILSYEECCAILKALFEGKVPAIVFQFLLFVTHKKRLSILKDIIESFDRLYLVQTDQLRAYVTTAMPIAEDEKAVFNQRLCDKCQHPMLTRWRTDPSLIGGFRVFLEGQIYDYSFKDQLNRFYQQATQPV